MKKDRILSASFVVLFCAALSVLALAGAVIAQNPPAAPAAGAAKTPPPPKASVEGTITKAGTGQGLRDAQISLRRSEDVAARAAQARALPPQLGALFEMAVAFGGPEATLAAANLNGPVAASAVSDKQGHFVITDIEPGDYIVAAERDGYIRQEYGQRADTSGGAVVTLVAGKRATIDFQLVPAGVISGKVTDPDGVTVADARVQAYTYRYAGGKRSMASVATAQTNDLGEYRLHPLNAGTYFISVTPRDGLPTDQIPQAAEPAGPASEREARIQLFINQGGQQAAFVQAFGVGTPPIYYPGVLDPTEATPVSVAVAAEVPAIDFHLRPIRTVKVSGRVEAPFELPSAAERAKAAQSLQGGRGFPGGGFGPGGGGGFIQVSPLGNGGPGQPQGQGGTNGPAIGNIQDMFSSAQTNMNIAAPIQVRFARVGAESQSPLAGLIGNGATPVDDNGKFQVTNVTPGSYNLTAIAKDPKGVEYTARMRVEVGNFDLEGLTIIPKPGVDVKGQIYADSTPADFKASQLRVSLVSDDNPNPLNLFASIFGAEPVGGLTAPVQADGSFVIKNAGALPYRVQVSGLPVGGYVLAGKYGEADPLGASFTADNPEAMLQLQVGFSAGNVSANVVDAAGKPIAGIVTALVPDEVRRGRADLYFSGSSDSNGRVSFANVPPGVYRLFAWEEIPTEAFRYGEFLRRYEDRAVSVSLEKKASVTVQVKAIPKTDN